MGLTKPAFVAQRTAEVWAIFDDYFDADALADNPLIRVASASTADEGYTQEYLASLVDVGMMPDLVAVTSHFGEGMADWVHETAQQHATSSDPWFYTGESFNSATGPRPLSLPPQDPYWKSTAFERHLDEAFDEWQDRLQEHEAGPGRLTRAVVESIEAVVGPVPIVASGGPALDTQHLDSADPGDEGITQFMTAMSRHARIADMYRTYLDAAFAIGLAMHVPYTLSDDYSAFSQSGHLEHIAQDPQTAPKYQALRNYLAEYAEGTTGTASDNLASLSTASASSSTTSSTSSAPSPTAASIPTSSTSTELLAAWNQPSNWRDCEKIGTEGSASIVNGRLRVSVTKPGEMGVRMYQKGRRAHPGQDLPGDRQTLSRYAAIRRHPGLQARLLQRHHRPGLRLQRQYEVSTWNSPPVAPRCTSVFTAAMAPLVPTWNSPICR